MVHYDPNNMMNYLKLEGVDRPMSMYRMHKSILFEFAEPEPPRSADPEFENHPFIIGKYKPEAQ